MTEIESSRDARDFRIPIFDKKSSDFCFEKSREILSKPLNFSIDTATLDKRLYDKKTRDLIGENLLDIEKTLNALNLDFLQAFNELEKTDSAETLFGEHFLFENNLKTLTNFNKKTFTSDIDNISSKISNSNNSNSSSNNINSNKKSTSRDYYSPLEKHSDKSFSPKDSQKTTPSSFSPQDTSATSRGVGFFNYPTKSRNLFLSPTKRMFNNQTQFTANKFDDSTATQQSQPRQRSMSFTDNFEIKSPGVVTTKPSNLTKMNLKTLDVRKTSSLDEEYGNRNFFLPSKSQLMAEKPRNVIMYKPKSVRARNLRRLSYNPINMIDSSSSSSESDLDKSMAHSECDIRSKIYSSRFQKRRQRYINRKSHRGTSSAYYRSENSQYSNSSNPNVNGRDKMYGSNASIKSAPHYNYMGERKKLLNEEQIVGCGGDDKTTMSSSDLESDEEFKDQLNDHRQNVINKDTRTLTPTPQPVQFTSNFNNIYEFVGKCFNRNFGSSTSNSSNGQQQQQQQKTITQSAIQQAQQFLQNDYRNYKRGNKISNSNLDLLYTDFDVTKLTGKSPTTQSYFDIIDYPSMSGKKSSSAILRESPLAANGGTLKSKGSSFQWPEKIHGSTVKQNDLIWQLQQQHEQDIKEKEDRRNQQRKLLMENLTLKKSAYSSSSSSTESLNYRQNYMPPSPAP